MCCRSEAHLKSMVAAAGVLSLWILQAHADQGLRSLVGTWRVDGISCKLKVGDFDDAYLKISASGKIDRHESSCKATKVKSSSSQIIFVENCKSEGEVIKSNVKVTMVTPDKILWSERGGPPTTYLRCGQAGNRTAEARSNGVSAVKVEGLETMTITKGRCNKLVLGQVSETCSSVVYTHFANGRTTWNFPTKNGAIMLSGGKDSQPNPERYRLNIDRARINNPGEPPVELSVQGMCESIVSTDGRFMRSLECRGGGASGRVHVDFVSDGSPVQIKHF